MNAESIEEIQTKIAFLERANAELSDVVFLQQREIRSLAARIDELAERLEATRPDSPHSAEDERPPHY